jgi:hypothetical protein
MTDREEIINKMLELGRAWGYDWSRDDVEQFVAGHQTRLREESFTL